MGIAIFEVLASLEPCFYALFIVRMALRRLTEKLSSSDEFNRKMVVLILPQGHPFYLHRTYHVCPVAWIKITKLCPCLPYFLGFLFIFKAWLFFPKMGGQTNTKQSNRVFLVSFSKVQHRNNNFSKSAAILTEK